MESSATTRPDWDPRAVIVVPALNQRPELERLLPHLLSYVPSESILFVDDGSSDGSPEVARRFGIGVTEHGTNRGIGAALRTGLTEARERGAEFAVIFSSNGKMRAEEIERVLGPVLDGSADYVTGSRFINGVTSPGIPAFRRFAIPLFSKLASRLLLRRNFSDITCGFRAYRLSLLEPIDLRQDWLDHYELEYYVHYHCCKNGARIHEVPVTIVYDHLPRGRRSKIVPILGWWSIVRTYVFLRLGIKR